MNSSGSYVWSPATDINDIHSLQPIVNPASNTSYILNFTSATGCGTSSDTAVVKVYNDIFIPNALSPNGDGLNDYWDIAGIGACSSFEVSVYSRWGQLVFYTKYKVKAWDGKFKGILLPAGVYTYTIKTCSMADLIKGTILLLK